jgi:hypothetical protein
MRAWCNITWKTDSSRINSAHTRTLFASQCL